MDKPNPVTREYVLSLPEKDRDLAIIMELAVRDSLAPVFKAKGIDPYYEEIADLMTSPHLPTTKEMQQDMMFEWVAREGREFAERLEGEGVTGYYFEKDGEYVFSLTKSAANKKAKIAGFENPESVVIETQRVYTEFWDRNYLQSKEKTGKVKPAS